MLEKQRFVNLWHRLGATNEADELLNALTAAYAEPHRAYHNAFHIVDCLGQLDQVSQFAEHPDEIEMALWFHDAAYDSHATDNEEKSASWATNDLSKGGVPGPTVHRIAELVLATRHQVLPESNDAKFIVDIDLSILGREQAIFDQYDQAIRQEYSWVPQWIYRRKRAEILGAFLARPFIYYTDWFRSRYEEKARENLNRVLIMLKSKSY
jgi:predicted metal-dependent HD superfamily phosphohydrolase